MAVLTLIESGELTKLQNKWWFDHTECKYSDKQDASRNELSLSNVAGIFFILIGGLLVALFVALIEFCFKHSRKDKQGGCMVGANATGLVNSNSIGGGGSNGNGGASIGITGSSGFGNTHSGVGGSSSTNNSKHISDSMKSKITLQSAREYDNGRVGVRIQCSSNVFRK